MLCARCVGEVTKTHCNTNLRLQPCTVSHLDLLRGWPSCSAARLRRSRQQLAPCCAVTPPKLVFSQRFRFCEICGNGTGTVQCTICHGTGTVVTKPGGAGLTFYVGEARCKICSGQGVVPCPLCAGYEDVMPPPDPDRPADHATDEPQQLSDDADDDDSWRRFGKVDITEAGHGW